MKRERRADYRNESADKTREINLIIETDYEEKVNEEEARGNLENRRWRIDGFSLRLAGLQEDGRLGWADDMGSIDPGRGFLVKFPP